MVEVRGSHHLAHRPAAFGHGDLMPPRTIQEMRVSSLDWDRGTVPIYVPLGQDGNGHIWTRGYDPIGESWTAWQKTAVIDRVLPSASISGGLTGDYRRRLRVGTFAFAESLPVHWEGDDRVSGFEPFTEAEREAFRAALDAWQIKRPDTLEEFQEIAPGVDNDAAEVMLFKSDIDGELFVIPNDLLENNSSGRLADVVVPINASWLGEDLLPGSRGYFEFLRAVGLMIGRWEHTESKLDSVLGDRDSGPENVWPSTPSAFDFIGGSPFYDPSGWNPDGPAGFTFVAENAEDNVYRFETSKRETFNTIRDAGGVDWLSGNNSGEFYISLRAGDKSGRWNGERLQFVQTVAFETEIENASGGNQNDQLYGNRFSNNLLGLAGDDVLFGDSGDDRLYGGAGNDTYRFDLADDRDVINELRSGGLDTIEIHGFGTFDSLDDLNVRRLGGGDLLIRLQLDGNEGHIQDSIRIRNMSDEASRVETLKLFWNDDQFATVSLPALYEQATEQGQRFRVTNGRDDYGQLARTI